MYLVTLFDLNEETEKKNHKSFFYQFTLISNTMKSRTILIVFLLSKICLTTSLTCYQCQKDGDGKCRGKYDVANKKEDCSDESLCFLVKHEHHKDTHCKCIFLLITIVWNDDLLVRHDVLQRRYKLETWIPMSQRNGKKVWICLQWGSLQCCKHK